MKNYFITLIFVAVSLLLAANGAFAQKIYSTNSSKAIKYFEKAQLSFDARKDDEAIDLLQKAIKADDKFVEAHMFLAEVFAEHKKYNEAIEEGKKAISINPDFFKSAYYSLGFWCLKTQMYDEAEKYFKHFLHYKGIKDESKSNATLGLRSAQFARNAIAQPVPFNPVNLGEMVNSPDPDYLPALTADEQTLIFTRLIMRNPKDDPKNMRNRSEDFYHSTKLNGKWTKAVNIGPPVNTPGNEGAQCISSDGQTFIFTACSEYNEYPGGRKGFGSCDLFIAKKQANGQWGVPENMGKPINTQYWESQPSLSSDGQTLYFASNRPGGKGSSDIWKCTKNAQGKWDNLENLGDSINTIAFEESPFIHPDNKTLYFASEGWPGMGGKDLYLARMKNNGTFATPVNLGYPINTPENERDLVVTASGKTAYFSSERDGGYGDLDLYSFDLYEAAQPQAVTYVKGMVFNKENNKGLEADFELIDLESGKTIMKANSMSGTGEYLVCIPTDRNYLMNVSRNGFLFASENFSLKGLSDNLNAFELNVALTPIKAGEKVVLKNIFFETASYQLKDESKIELQKLINFLNLNKGVSVEISGHTDNVGDNKQNQILSENRAKAVYDYLINNKITQQRLSYKGYGNTMPIDDNNTESGRANNRRTEFMIVK
ncbi:MAG: PD40 domain-containing protein [Bacteroidia bacterium]|nr:PD40 domain-containing protein [Bacteroidia bacterium]